MIEDTFDYGRHWYPYTDKDGKYHVTQDPLAMWIQWLETEMDAIYD